VELSSDQAVDEIERHARKDAVVGKPCDYPRFPPPPRRQRAAIVLNQMNSIAHVDPQARWIGDKANREQDWESDEASHQVP
jgi:hypothetical protein